MLKARLMDTATGKDLHTYPDPSGHPTLVTSNYGRLHGTFGSVTVSAGTTTVIVTARGNQGVVLTDLIISLGKQNGASAIVRFNDAASNTIVVAQVIRDVGASMSIPFQGNWAGWQGSYLD